MNNILDASCNQSGEVSVSGVKVPDAVVLSEGKAESEGLLFIEGSRARYLPSSATDIKSLIISLVAIIDQIILISTSLDGTSTSPGTAAPAITQLGVLKTQLDQTKEMLK